MNNDIIEKLNAHVDGIAECVELLKADRRKNPKDVSEPMDHTPWLTEAEKYLGLHEKGNNAELCELLSVDPAKFAWCADFLNAILEKCGYEGTGTCRALDFAKYGLHCEEKDGCIMVFETEIGGHVGIKKGDKLLGGNQGDSVKYSNLAWFKKNMKLVATRLPATFNV